MPDPIVTPHVGLKNLELNMKGVQIDDVHKEIMKGKILDSALATLKNSPGFNPAAISVVFGLKW